MEQESENREKDQGLGDLGGKGEGNVPWRPHWRRERVRKKERAKERERDVNSGQHSLIQAARVEFPAKRSGEENCRVETDIPFQRVGKTGEIPDPVPFRYR